MASGIPTRRAAGRRPDENAPPGAGSRSRSTQSVALASKPSTSTHTSTSSALAQVQAGSGIPMLKRNASSANTVETSDTSTRSRMPKKRSALGEVTNAPKKVEKVDGKGKGATGGVVDKEDRKSMTTAAGRRTRSTLSGSTRVDDGPSGIPAPKRRPTAPIPTTRTHSSRTRPGTASAATSRQALKDRHANRDDEVVAVPEPQRKKRKTSSPPLINEAEVVVEDDNEDLADPAVYDEDGQEVLLSSGGKGTHLRSPKRVRAKDEGWTDLDAEDEMDPAMVSEYVIDAFNYMMVLEVKTLPEADYMNAQTELDWGMRAIVMDWIIEVHTKFRLLPETLFIATNLIDRFLSSRVISLEKLQLVGITCLFVAAKYEEVICPSIAHFINMTDGGYDTTEMIKAERYLLQTLDFDLSFPNPLHFLRRISKADGYDIQTRTVSKFLIEIGCLDRRLLEFKPSMMAAAAMYLARACLERGDWTPNLVHYSTYSLEELLPCAQVMLDYMLDPDFNADSFFYKKYAGKKHMKSSTYVRQWAIRMWPSSANGTSKHRGRELYLELGFDDGN